MKGVLYVIWNDAVSIDEWTAEDDVHPTTSEIHSVGIFVKESKEVLVLALNKDVSENNYSCMIHIPKRWILKRVAIS